MKGKVLAIVLGLFILSAPNVLAQEPCKGDFNYDGNVDANDVVAFIADFGRSIYLSPCTNALPCNGDFLCDVDVDADDVTKFLEDFGRSAFFLPCPICPGGPWCTYP